MPRNKKKCGIFVSESHPASRSPIRSGMTGRDAGEDRKRLVREDGKRISTVGIRVWGADGVAARGS